MKRMNHFYKLIGLGAMALLGLGGCNIGKGKESTAKSFEDLWSNNLSVNNPNGTSKGLFPQRRVQICRKKFDHKQIIRIGLPTERFAAPPQTADEKAAAEKNANIIEKLKAAESRPRTDQKYLLLQYSRDLSNPRVLTPDKDYSGWASMQTNYVPNFSNSEDGEVLCDFLGDMQAPPSAIKVGQILRIPMHLLYSTKPYFTSIYIHFKVTSKIDWPSVKEVDAIRPNDWRQKSDWVRLKGTFLPFDAFRKKEKIERGKDSIQKIFGQDLGKGMPIFQSAIVADSDSTGFDDERPGHLVGFLKDIIIPVAYKRGQDCGRLELDPEKDLQNLESYIFDEKTEYYLTVGNTVF